MKYTKSSFKENPRTFSKSSITQGISRLKKRLRNLYRKENFKPKIKPITKTLQDELYQLKSKSFKSWLNNALKLFSKYLIESICKIKQYLNYILKIIAILLIFSNLQKNCYEILYTKKTTSKTATTEFLSKIPNRKKISNEQFHLCEAKSL